MWPVHPAGCLQKSCLRGEPTDKGALPNREIEWQTEEWHCKGPEGGHSRKGGKSVEEENNIRYCRGGGRGGLCQPTSSPPLGIPNLGRGEDGNFQSKRFDCDTVWQQGLLGGQEASE